MKKKKKRRRSGGDFQTPSILRQFRTGNWKILISLCRSRVFFVILMSVLQMFLFDNNSHSL